VRKPAARSAFVALIVVVPLLLALVAVAQTIVMAPGAQIPGAPLPRYIYNTITADFAVPEGYPLIKTKFSLYDTIGPTRQQFDQNISLMHELNVDNYRLELGWGRPRQGHGMHAAVGGTLENLTYNFEPLDHIVRELKNQDVLFLCSYSYTPLPLQDLSLERQYGEKKEKVRDATPPKNLEKWKEVVTAFVKHHKEVGLPFGVHEIWNEPDGTYFFFSGTEAEYYQLYKAAVEAIRAVDPDAFVAGPASDHHLLFNQGFPEFVAKNKLPLDAYSFHHYSSATLAQRDIGQVIESLNRFPVFNTTTMSITEWNTSDWAAGAPGACERATQLLHDFDLFLKRPEISNVSWTTWMGLMTKDGHRRADFNAWKLYGMMPVDRRQVTIQGPLEAFASADDHRAGLVIWNREAFNRRLDVQLKNVPFRKGTVRIYRIDRKNASYDDKAGEELVAVETHSNVDTSSFTWQDGVVPPYGILYFQVDDGTGESELAPSKTGTVLRINRYYPARGRTNSYSDFDRKTWIARLGMMDNAKADEQIGVLADGLPDAIDVAVKVEGKLQKLSSNSLLGIRLDYRVNDKYAKAVLFHGRAGGVDLYDKGGKATLPWGLKQQLDDVVAVPDLAKFQIPVKKLAPAGWTGKVHISFLLQQAGRGAQAKLSVRPGK
jgi:xylan 1,4-beta-xylosidase